MRASKVHITLRVCDGLPGVSVRDLSLEREYLYASDTHTNTARHGR